MASRIVTRTAIGAAIQTARGLNLKHNVLNFTTLNQAISERTIVANLPEPLTRGMDVLPSYDYATDSNNLAAQYICIGNGGHKSIVSSGTGMSIPFTLPVEHRTTDTGMYSMIPFLGRPVTDGLTASERRNYGLRRTIMVGNTMWEFYFARKLDFDRATPTINITHVVDGEATSVEYVPTLDNLKPTHPTTEDTAYNGSYASITTPVEVVWTEAQIQDIRDACRVLYGSENYAIISEMAICSAVEKQIEMKYPNEGVQNPSAVAANTFFEAVACQIIMHISTYIPILYAEREYKLQMDFGATEPLYGVSAG